MIGAYAGAVSNWGNANGVGLRDFLWSVEANKILIIARNRFLKLDETGSHLRLLSLDVCFMVLL